MEYLGKIHVKWQTIYGATRRLAKKILKDWDVSAIVTIPLGGLPPTKFMADLLRVTKEHVYITSSLMRDADYRYLVQKYHHGIILLFDEIVDSGKQMSETLKKLLTAKKNTRFDVKILTATLYYKPVSSYRPDYYVVETSDWVVFPWEKFQEK